MQATASEGRGNRIAAVAVSLFVSPSARHNCHWWRPDCWRHFYPSPRHAPGCGGPARFWVSPAIILRKSCKHTVEALALANQSPRRHCLSNQGHENRTDNIDGPASPKANGWRIASVALLIAGGALVSAAQSGGEPGCAGNKFQIPHGQYILFEQDNGIEVSVDGFETQVTSAHYSHPGQDDTTGGTAEGGIVFGRAISINVIWDQGPGAGLSNRYEGDINSDGSAQGTTRNNLGTTNTWTTKYNLRFECIADKQDRPRRRPPLPKTRACTTSPTEWDSESVTCPPAECFP
jgi:hypothetical protein